MPKEPIERIKGVVADILEMDDGEIQPDSHFLEDLGADSMKAVELLARIEQEFDVTIDPDELERMITPEGALDVVGEYRDGE